MVHFGHQEFTVPRKPATEPYPAPRIPVRRIPLERASQLVEILWPQFDLYPETTRALAEDEVEHLLLLARGSGAGTLADLTGELADKVLQLAAGPVPSAHEEVIARRQRLRHQRNLLLLLHATAALSIRRPGTGEEPNPDEQSSADQDDRRLPPAVYPRSVGYRCGTPRPFFDDEIALARAYMWRLNHGAGLRAGNAYTLLEAGATCRDASAARRDHLNDPQEPTTIRMPRLALREERQLNLTSFGAKLLARNLGLLDRRGQPSEHLAYLGRASSSTQPGERKAGMSVQGSLNQHLAWAGIEDAATNATGISTWRIRHLLTTQGQRAAMHAAFGRAGDLGEAKYADRIRRLYVDTHCSYDDAA